MYDVPRIIMQMMGNQLVFKQGISLKGYNNTIDNKIGRASVGKEC